MAKAPTANQLSASFNAEVQRLRDSGLSLKEATKAAIKANPGLYIDMLKACGASDSQVIACFRKLVPNRS